MTWGIPSHLFLEIHVALSLIGIVAGLLVLYGLLNGISYPGWTALFLATTILTSITGFPIPPFGFDPPRAVGTLSLVLLAIAVCAFYAFHLAGTWRWVYVVTATAALYLNCFVAVVQAFEKVPFLQSLAPTQSEPPFLIAQAIVLALFPRGRRGLSTPVGWQPISSLPNFGEPLCPAARLPQATKFASRQRTHFPSDCLRRIESVYPFRRIASPPAGAIVISM